MLYQRSLLERFLDLVMQTTTDRLLTEHVMELVVEVGRACAVVGLGVLSMRELVRCCPALGAGSRRLALPILVGWRDRGRSASWCGGIAVVVA